MRVENSLKAQQADALRRQDFDLYTNATGLLDELYEKRKNEDSVAGFEEFIDDDGDNESLRRLKEQLSDPSLKLLRKQLSGSSYTLRLHKTGVDGVIPISTLEDSGEDMEILLGDEVRTRVFSTANEYDYDNSWGIETVLVVVDENVDLSDEEMANITSHMGYAAASVLHQKGGHRLRYNRVAKNAFVVNGFYDIDWNRTEKVSKFIDGETIRGFINEGSPQRRDGTRLVQKLGKNISPRFLFTQPN